MDERVDFLDDQILDPEFDEDPFVVEEIVRGAAGFDLLSVWSSIGHGDPEGKSGRAAKKAQETRRNPQPKLKKWKAPRHFSLADDGPEIVYGDIYVDQYANGLKKHLGPYWQLLTKDVLIDYIKEYLR